MTINDLARNLASLDIPLRKLNNPELYAQVMVATTFLPASAKIKERIYNIIHNFTNQQSCNSCNQLVKFLGPHAGYRSFCSTKCSSNSETKKDTIRQTNITRLGVPVPAQSRSIKAKMKATVIERYGVEYSSQIPERQSLATQTMLDRYGAASFVGSHKFKQLIADKRTAGIRSPKQIHFSEETFEILSDKSRLYEMNQSGLLLTEIAKIIGVSIATVSVYFAKHRIEPIRPFGSSLAEREISQFIMSHNIEIVSNTRQLLKSGKEIDIYIPHLNLAIEYCGLYWHADLHQRMHPTYHYDKMIECRKLGIRLITIFEDEWKQRRSIVERMLVHAIGCSRTEVFARKCNIVHDISVASAKEFFEANHIQGWGRGSITTALTYNDKIVAMMSFIARSNGVYELNRFATSGLVPGSFSKLLKDFCKSNPSTQTIESFCELRWGDGHTYTKSGFVLVSQSRPSYSYLVNNFTSRKHRMHFQRSKLEHMLEQFDPNLTEQQNCANHGLYRIWDCGQLKIAYTVPVKHIMLTQ